MPITESVKKALRQSFKKRTRNIRKKKNIKILLKKLRVLISEKKTKEAENILPQIYKALDKAAKAGIIKKNTASRRKSRITKSINRK